VKGLFEQALPEIKKGMVPPGPEVFELEMPKKDGSTVWIEIKASLSFDSSGRPLGILGFSRDISERKKLEHIQKILVNISDAIIFSPSLETFAHLIFIELQKIIHLSNFYIALFNEETKMFSTVFIADAIDESVTDFPAGKTLSYYVIRKREAQLIDREVYAELYRSGEVEELGPSSEVWIGVPIFEKEKAVGVMVIQNYEGEKDLTEEDLKIVQYVSPAISLAIERKKFIEDLKNAKEKAEESNRLKSAFLANMSHEIRTPMNGILGFLTLLKSPELTDDKKERYIRIVNESGQRRYYSDKD